MAKRYCGGVTVTIAWNDQGWYEGRVSVSPQQGWNFDQLRDPAASRLAVDSPEAYDLATSAALSFASNPPTAEHRGGPHADLAEAIAEALEYQPLDWFRDAWLKEARPALGGPGAFVARPHCVSGIYFGMYVIARSREAMDAYYEIGDRIPRRTT